jgi:hypothetical protein
MTLATSQIPSHNHSVTRHAYSSGNAQGSYVGTRHYGDLGSFTTGSTGGGGSHTHGNTAATTPGQSDSTTPGATGSTTPGATGSANAHSHTISAPQYIDVIICSKDA